MLSTILFLTLAADPTPPGQIAFMRGGRVWLVNADGTNEKALTDELPMKLDRPVTWMPDGQKLLYWHHSKIGWDIWSVNADGTGHANLTKCEKGGCRSPAPSPDGKLIAFMRDEPEGLFVMNADGSNQRRLTDGGHRDGVPAWSPNGRHLVYTRFEKDGPVLYQTELATKTDRRLYSGESPTWSRKPKVWLAFTQKEPFVSLRIADPNSGEACPNVNTGPASYPAFSPASTFVVFFSQFDQVTVLRFLVDDFDAEGTIITVRGRPYAPASWSTDDEWLTFCAGPDNKPRIYVVNWLRKAPRMIGGEGAWFPAWRPQPKSAK